jgi:hypothetical protein
LLLRGDMKLAVINGATSGRRKPAAGDPIVTWKAQTHATSRFVFPRDDWIAARFAGWSHAIPVTCPPSRASAASRSTDCLPVQIETSFVCFVPFGPS